MKKWTLQDAIVYHESRNDKAEKLGVRVYYTRFFVKKRGLNWDEVNFFRKLVSAVILSALCHKSEEERDQVHSVWVHSAHKVAIGEDPKARGSDNEDVFVV